MRNINKRIFLAVIIGALFSACTKDLSEINVDPNKIGSAEPENLFAPAIHSLVNNNLNRSKRINNEFMQVHVTDNNNNDFHRYEVRPSESEYMWNNWYVRLTAFRASYQRSIALSEAIPAYKTFAGMSLIMDALVSSYITDLYGDIPYFDANKGKEGIIQPKFDRQEDIYKDLFRKLEEANTLLTGQAALPEAQVFADPIYNGDAAKWRKFGNSLYLRLLLRVSGKPSSGAVDLIKKIAETEKSAYPMMASNADAAVLRFTPTPPLVSEFYNYRVLDFNGGIGYTEFFINTLNAWGDPRREKWATISGGSYMGVASGYLSGQTPERLSIPKTELMNEPLMGNILNYAEVQFMLAEASLKAYINPASTKTFYDNGVTSAITFWGLEVPEAYLDKEDVKWNETRTPEQKLEAIILQKYFTLFFTDFQQWSEYRRTSYPVLPIGPGLLNNAKMPSRFRYPVKVQALNTQNYNEAVAIIGTDDLNSKVWWDTEN
jgi:hypothetical protein